MARLLVTGGAGFIGANFVHYWSRCHPDDRLVVLDALTYAGIRASLPELGEERLRFVEGDIREQADVERLLREEQLDTIVHFAAESHVDRSISGPEHFVDVNVLGTLSLLEAARRVWLEDGPLRASLPPRLDGRGLRLSGAGGPGVHRVDAVRSQLAVRGEQGGRRPSRARLSRDVRAVRDDQQLLQQLRPVPLPREAHPALHRQSPGRQGAAGLRRRGQRSRLAARRRSLPGDRVHPRGGPAGPGLQRGDSQRTQQPRGRGAALPCRGRSIREGRRPGAPLSRRGAGAWRALLEPDPLCPRSPGTRHALRHRPEPSGVRARLHGRSRLRRRARRHGPLVPGQRALVAGDPRARQLSGLDSPSVR